DCDLRLGVLGLVRLGVLTDHDAVVAGPVHGPRCDLDVLEPGRLENRPGLRLGVADVGDVRHPYEVALGDHEYDLAVLRDRTAGYRVGADPRVGRLLAGLLDHVGDEMALLQLPDGVGLVEVDHVRHGHLVGAAAVGVAHPVADVDPGAGVRIWGGARVERAGGVDLQRRLGPQPQPLQLGARLFVSLPDQLWNGALAGLAGHDQPHR